MSEQDAYALNRQGLQSFEQGHYKRAIKCFEEANALAYSVGDNEQEMVALTNLSAAWHNFGDFQKKVEVVTRLLARARQIENEHYKMDAIYYLATALARLDLRSRWRELKPLLLEGLQTAHQLKSHALEVNFLTLLGRYAVKMGEEDQGFSYLQQALNILQIDGIDLRNYFLGAAYGSLSVLMAKRENKAEAIRYAEMAIDTRRKTGNPQYIATSQLLLVRAEVAQEQYADALRLIEQVFNQSQQMDWKGKEQEAAYLKGEIEYKLRNYQEARVFAERALELAQSMKLKEEEVECLLSVGQILFALKQPDEALEKFKQAYRLSQERNYDDHFAKAEALLQTVSMREAQS